MHASYPGSSPETPKHVEMWAVWFPAPADAAEAISKTAGVSDLPTATLCKLSDEHMRSLGLREEGQVARIRCISGRARPTEAPGRRLSRAGHVARGPSASLRSSSAGRHDLVGILHHRTHDAAAARQLVINSPDSPRIEPPTSRWSWPALVYRSSVPRRSEAESLALRAASVWKTETELRAARNSAPAAGQGRRAVSSCRSSSWICWISASRSHCLVRR